MQGFGKTGVFLLRRSMGVPFGCLQMGATFSEEGPSICYNGDRTCSRNISVATRVPAARAQGPARECGQAGDVPPAAAPRRRLKFKFRNLAKSAGVVGPGSRRPCREHNAAGALAMATSPTRWPPCQG